MKEKLVNIFKNLKEFILTHKSIIMKIIALLIVIIAIIVIGSCFKGTKYGNSAGNSYNAGIAVQKEGYIYYVELDSGKPIGICKIKNNGKKAERIAKCNVTGALNIIDNYIYCVEYNEEEERNDLIRIKTNGKNKEILARDISDADDRQVLATDKWIYYYKNDILYRVNLNGTDREKISDKNISYYTIDGKWIYFIYKTDKSQSYIARMELNGQKTERITKAADDEEYESLYVKNGKIYFVSSKLSKDYDQEYSLYQVNKNGKNLEKICKIDEEIHHINMQENGIYYTTTENYEDYKIKYVKYNGKDKKTIKEETGVSAINITKDWIFIAGIDESYDTTIKMVSIKGNKEKDL